MRFVLTLLSCLAPAVMISCDEDQPLATEDSEALSKGRGLGVCFMGSQPCMDMYEDKGEYTEHVERDTPVGGKTSYGIPVYVFASVPAKEGGKPSPCDPEGRYRPYRLQNNVFAEPRIIWEMWLVKSGTLNLMARPSEEVTLWGVGADQSAMPSDNIKNPGARDLFTNSFRSEAEILDCASLGLVRMETTFMLVDCPVTTSTEDDVVVNLNPGFPLCAN